MMNSLQSLEQVFKAIQRIPRLPLIEARNLNNTLFVNENLMVILSINIVIVFLHKTQQQEFVINVSLISDQLNHPILSFFAATVFPH